MKTEVRKVYLSPSAEVICLAPSESIAAWTFGSDKDSWLWGSNKFAWGAEVPNTASITATTTWTDELDLTE